MARILRQPRLASLGNHGTRRHTHRGDIATEIPYYCGSSADPCPRSDLPTRGNDSSDPDKGSRFDDHGTCQACSGSNVYECADRTIVIDRRARIYDHVLTDRRVWLNHGASKDDGASANHDARVDDG